MGCEASLSKAESKDSSQLPTAQSVFIQQQRSTNNNAAKPKRPINRKDARLMMSTVRAEANLKRPAHWSEVISKRPVNERHEKEFIHEALKAHNDYRSEHGAPPLEHAQKLTEHAQQLSNELAKRDLLLHSNCILPDGELIGENIYSFWCPDDTIGVKASVVVRNWYNEIEHYDFSTDVGSSKTANFTQLIWKSTKEFGIAKARSLDGTVYVVAVYKPVGNVTGLFRDNVKPELKPNNNEKLDRQSSASSDNSSFDYSKYGDLTNRVKTENNRIVIDLIIDEAKRSEP